jgi:hypothetical protein
MSSKKPRSVPYDTVDYLKTPEDILGYLEAVIEDDDDRVLSAAIDDSVRAAKRLLPAKMAGFFDDPAELNLNRVKFLARALGFEFTFRPKQAA